ncbi:hypothetical protein BI347_12305 [Chromobacterium sphagni]|uniref:HTH araC/xylS-type domain-containing protein n=1 Tax=Chromobacterium sphagni TaxID=1903179 RepID=A0A1S1X3Z2_9NEIS|nr:AraC family transcriptional regulator [Chromobacterium sphagni]OHX14202.1 hypothetical protein BI347_12305 [Chromobacterium sphagni]
MRTPYRNSGLDSPYLRRMLKALDYLWRHLDASVSLERLAEEACLSPYHFHRVYHALMAETVGETRQRLLLHRAAGELGGSPLPLLRVAARAGYGSAAAFIRAFSQAYGESPGRYRKRRAFIVRQNRESLMHEVSMLKQQQGLRVLMRRNRGSYMEIGQAFGALQAISAGHEAGEAPGRVFAMFLDDPEQISAAELRSIACVTAPAGWEDKALPEGFEWGEIPAGEYACAMHLGPYAELKTTWDWLYRHWLPDSGQVPGDVPCIEEYLNSPYDTAPKDLRTRLMLSLA